MPRTIFVTGAGGFIGRRAVEALAALPDCTVKILTRRPLDGVGTVEQIVGDLLDPASFAGALAGCDTVVHLAATTGRAAAADYEQVNVEGTRRLLAACKAAGVSRILHVSTIAAGYPNQRYYPYAKTKARAEQLVRESGLAFAIIRPTIVLGDASPIWATLLKIAKLPVIPLPQGGKAVSVQPIHVDDIVRGIGVVVAEDRFDGEVLDLGGPAPLTFAAFLKLVQQELHGKEGRLFRVPLAPIRAMLALMEPALRPLMPVTAGQLAVFANDSVSSHNWLHERLLPQMASTRETVAALLAAGGTDAGDDGRGAARPEPETRPLTDHARTLLRQECATFSACLVGTPPGAYVEAQYLRATHLHRLAFDEDFDRFDRATLTFARMGSFFTRAADAYCAFFRRRGALRRKLIVLAAILEHVEPTSFAFDRVETRGPAFTLLALAGHGLMSALALTVGAVVLIPAALVSRLSPRPSASWVPR